MKSLFWTLFIFLYLVFPQVNSEEDRKSDGPTNAESIRKYLSEQYFAEKYEGMVSTKTKGFFSTMLKIMQQEERAKLKKIGMKEERKKREELEFYRELQVHFRQMLHDVQMENRSDQ